MCITVFEHIVSLFGRYITDYDSLKIFHFLSYLIYPLIYIYRIIDCILITPCLNLIYKVCRRSFTIYKQNLPRLENSVVEMDYHKVPYRGKSHLNCHCSNHIHGIYYSECQKAYYKIHHHIRQKQAEILRQHNLKPPVLPYFHASIHR